MKIYTRTGDEGSTSLFSGERVSKTNLRVEACGALDELNCIIGVARAASPAAPAEAYLAKIQSQLFSLGADLATSGRKPGAPCITHADVEWLETEIDRMTSDLPPLRHFILPGGSASAAQIHLARAVCRRAERVVVDLATSEEFGGDALRFLNRLSDFLFTLARNENLLSGFPEQEWIPGD
ncbi:MAG: cob(I)yrinic acid a,c-diamide adenosyltransferase [Terrimicrobiaceae bacterium]